MRDAVLDLLVGSRCVVCRSPGRALCPRCRGELPRAPFVCWPTPAPAGLAAPWAAAAYEGAVRRMILCHKEQARFALAAPLGALLAGAVEAALRARPPTGPALLVPVPSHPSVVRGRGHDPMLRVARAASRQLRSRGVSAGVHRGLAVVVRPADQAGLDATARAANLTGAFRARAAPRLPVVVVDDVLTTGSTAREAQRALEERGVEVLAVVTVAATTRRHRTHGPSPGTEKWP